jgi:hypothetical protein
MLKRWSETQHVILTLDNFAHRYFFLNVRKVAYCVELGHVIVFSAFLKEKIVTASWKTTDEAQDKIRSTKAK